MKDAEKSCNVGLLIMRLGLGAMFIMHGYPKMFGGVGAWSGLGKTMGMFGITFVPQLWGFMAALAEFGGGICLIGGFFFRPACALLLFNMAVASAMHLNKGDGLMGASHAIEAAIVFLGLMWCGPGVFVFKPGTSCGCCGTKT